MNIALRILVIFILMLNGVSLWFASALYAKRTLLINRNIVLENAIVSFAKTLDKDELPVAIGEFTSVDISPVTLQNADINPDVSDFWDSYQFQLETIDVIRYDITDRKDELTEIYILDAEKKPVLAPNGLAITDGAPMDILLKEVQDKAMKQANRLNLVRAELTKIRVELESVIEDLNATKKAGRIDKKTIQARENTISELESKVADLESTVADLESNVEMLEEEKATLQDELDSAMEDNEILLGELEKLRESLRLAILQGPSGGGSSNIASANILAGVKGTVMAADNTLNFAIIRVTDTTMDELLGAARDRLLPDMEMLVHRKGDSNDVVLGKLRLRTLTKGQNLITCDILANWKQDDIKPDDEVFYLD